MNDSVASEVGRYLLEEKGLKYSTWKAGLYENPAELFYNAYEIKAAHRRLKHSVVFKMGENVIILSQGIPMFEITERCGYTQMYIERNYESDELLRDAFDFAHAKAAELGVKITVRSFTRVDRKTRKEFSINNDKQIIQY